MKCRFAICAAALLGCYAQKPIPANAIRIGALLPFSGQQASGVNLEEALLQAMEQVNAAGGIAGRPLALISRDTHSNTEVGIAQGSALLNDDGARIVIGPEEGDIAIGMISALKAAGAVQFLAGLTVPIIRDTTGEAAWFHLGPSAAEVGCVIAQNVVNSGGKKPVVFYDNDSYNISLANAVNLYTSQLGAQNAPSLSIVAGRSDYSSLIQSAFDSQADSFVLLGYPLSAALLIQSWDAVRGSTNDHWYWSPTLETQEFIDNIPPASLEGSLGVSASIPQASHVFDASFSARWGGDIPLASAYFYYDSMAIAALGLQAAMHQTNASTLPNATTLQHGVFAVTSGVGEVIAWNELAKGLQLASQGTAIDYHGLSGLLKFDGNGNVFGSQLRLWTIEGSTIVNGDVTDCAHP